PSTLPSGSGEVETIRYQYSNVLQSVGLELDQNADIISYEEYYPFGGTSYSAPENDIDVPRKRYKYCGKEQDEETGLYYYGARYYAPWLCRFSSVDPKALEYIHQSSYVFAANNPIVKYDVNGEGTNGDGCAGENQPQASSPPSGLNNLGKGDESNNKYPQNKNINNFEVRTTYNGDKDKGYGFASPAMVEIAKKNNGMAGDMEIFWNPDAKGLSGKGDHFYQKVSSNDYLSRKTPLEKITPIGFKALDRPEVVLKPNLVLQKIPNANNQKPTRPILPTFNDGAGFVPSTAITPAMIDQPGDLSFQMVNFLNQVGAALKPLGKDLKSISVTIDYNLVPGVATNQQAGFLRNVSMERAASNMITILTRYVDNNVRINPIIIFTRLDNGSSGNGTSINYRLKNE
ncbi:MAG TPA: RHS repeat-associated core domain-containing protein, partial [Bacteroidia bacterium]|nr:RHS repeat-associated core domain-containing protein [Bacteroidia bacterium]